MSGVRFGALLSEKSKLGPQRSLYVIQNPPVASMVPPPLRTCCRFGAFFWLARPIHKSCSGALDSSRQGRRSDVLGARFGPVLTEISNKAGSQVSMYGRPSWPIHNSCSGALDSSRQGRSSDVQIGRSGALLTEVPNKAGSQVGMSTFCLPLPHVLPCFAFLVGRLPGRILHPGLRHRILHIISYSCLG